MKKELSVTITNTNGSEYEFMIIDNESGDTRGFKIDKKDFTFDSIHKLGDKLYSFIK